MKKFFLWGLPLFFFFACSSGGVDISSGETPDLPVYEHDNGTTFYLSNSGNDSNNGLSPNSAWKSINKLNAMLAEFHPGDVFLFNRGDLFRGYLLPSSGASGNWIKYSSYGNGEKPVLSGSMELNSSEDWVHHNSSIWKSSFDLYIDVGALFMNGDHSVIGERKWSIDELSKNGDFYFDPNGNINSLFLFCDSGSPELKYTNIEASLKQSIIDLDKSSFILFENLHITEGAAHGISGVDTSHIIIRACDFSYIGGGFLYMDDNKPVRFGNGIEFWGNGNNNLVDGNKFWEIYDTAVTNQNHTIPSIQENLFYMNNIMWNCGLASFELWNRPSESLMQHVYFLNNTSINPGFGWGGAEHRPDKNSFHMASFNNEAQGDNLVIKNNIFYSSQTPLSADHHILLFLEGTNGEAGDYIINNNLWYMPDPLWMTNSETVSVYRDLSQWQEATNWSSQGIFEDPLFLDFNTDNFAISSGSPAIDAGDEFLRMYDFYRNTASGAVDLGAIEYK